MRERQSIAQVWGISILSPLEIAELGLEGATTYIQYLRASPALILLDEGGIIRWHSEGIQPAPAGDTSTDFNFYTKRATLAGVYSSTLLYWLNDRSPGAEQTWSFLDRRIDDVMKIEKLKSQVKSWTGGGSKAAARR